VLADLDVEALPGTESDVEVIAEMTADDLDPAASKRSPTPAPDPAPAPAPDPAPDDPDSGMSFDSFQRLSAFAAADEPDWFTRCISRGGPTSETLTEAEIADVEPPSPTPATPPVWWIGPADDPDGLEWTPEAYERLCALADAKETTDLIAEVIEAEIAKKAAAEAAPAPPAPDPAPTPGPAPDVAPAIGLTSDELEAVADLERKPSDELSHEVTTSHPELSDPVAPKRLTPFLQYMQRKREKIAAKAREKTRKRVQRHRTALAPKKAKKAASSLPSVKVLLKKLQKAVAE
jgi:hypothetical protein